MVVWLIYYEQRNCLILEWSKRWWWCGWQKKVPVNLLSPSKAYFLLVTWRKLVAASCSSVAYGTNQLFKKTTTNYWTQRKQQGCFFFWELGTLIIASTLLGNYVSSLKMIGFKWTVDHNCWGPTIQKWQFFVTPTNVCALVWYSLLEFHVRKVWPFFIEATKDPMGSSLLFGIKWSVNPAILCFFPQL